MENRATKKIRCWWCGENFLADRFDVFCPKCQAIFDEGKTVKQVKACLLVAGSLLLLVLLLLSACSPLEKAIQQSNGNLTPEQIQAYDAAGMAVVGCLMVAGPPPNGSGSVIVMPKTAKGNLSVNVDCHTNGTISLEGSLPTGQTR